MKEDGRIYRQGDVLIITTDRKVSGTEVPRDKGRVILAYGEVTGHAHAIVADEAVLTRDEALGTRFLQVLAEGGVELVHEEHGTITLPRGDYEVWTQVEVTPFGERRVLD